MVIQTIGHKHIRLCGLDGRNSLHFTRQRSISKVATIDDILFDEVENPPVRSGRPPQQFQDQVEHESSASAAPRDL